VSPRGPPGAEQDECRCAGIANNASLYNLGVHFVGSLYQQRAIKTWLRDQPDGWVIASGDWSPFYFAFRDVPSYPQLFGEACELLSSAIEKRDGEFDRLIGVASTGIALTGAVAQMLRVPMGFTRKVIGVRTAEDLQKATNAWGGHSIVEGVMQDGDRILVVDDVITTFTSKATAIAQIEAEAQSRGVHVEVVGVAVVVDRSGKRSAEAPVPVTSAIDLLDELDAMRVGGASDREVDVIRRYLLDPTPFQNPDVRAAMQVEAK